MGYFAISGCDASGKSTQLKLLADWLKESGHQVLETKEPGSQHDPTCRKIREILLDPANDITPKAALHLFLSDRVSHLQNVVLPALERTSIVVQDRSSVCTLAYYMAELSQTFPETAVVQALNHAQLVRPDICFITESSTDFADQVLDLKGRDRIESKGSGFYRAVRERYQALAGREDTWLAAQPFLPKELVRLPSIPEASQEEIAGLIRKRIEEWISFSHISA